jgi:hypothetical protein
MSPMLLPTVSTSARFSSGMQVSGTPAKRTLVPGDGALLREQRDIEAREFSPKPQRQL